MASSRGPFYRLGLGIIERGVAETGRPDAIRDVVPYVLVVS
jgi:hypothetical protein